MYPHVDTRFCRFTVTYVQYPSTQCRGITAIRFDDGSSNLSGVNGFSSRGTRESLVARLTSCVLIAISRDTLCFIHNWGCTDKIVFSFSEYATLPSALHIIFFTKILKRQGDLLTLRMKSSETIFRKRERARIYTKGDILSHSVTLLLYYIKSVDWETDWLIHQRRTETSEAKNMKFG